MMLAAPIMAVGGLVFAVQEDVELSSILLFSIPLLVICVGTVISRMIPRFRVMQDRIDGINRILREQLTGIRVVRAFVREPHETKRFEQVNAQVTESGLQAGHLQAFFFPIVLVIVNGSSIAAIWLAANRIDSGDMSIGALVAFLTYLALILQSVMMASLMAALVPRASICADRIVEVLDTPSSVVAPAAPVVPQGTMLELREVTFQYPGAEAPVLDRVSFIVRPGETTAIVGSTGAGKTTLVNLIPRLADVTSGSLCFGGVDVREVDTAVLWSRIGLVPQRPYLFSGTVASNLRYGKHDATDDELWEALRVAQAADFVRAMPGGLDAPIAQGGTNVSGGQRQRLSIARALVRRPDLYVFDDSFSALDLRTDAMLRAALKPYTADAGVVIVAQRVSTVMDADQIVVLEDGKVVGLGRHDDLVESCPTYAEIVESQGVARERAR
jgi:ATP-binding cassette subfamily B protein